MRASPGKQCSPRRETTDRGPSDAPAATATRHNHLPPPPPAATARWRCWRRRCRHNIIKLPLSSPGIFPGGVVASHPCNTIHLVASAPLPHVSERQPYPAPARLSWLHFVLNRGWVRWQGEFTGSLRGVTGPGNTADGVALTLGQTNTAPRHG